MSYRSRISNVPTPRFKLMRREVAGALVRLGLLGLKGQPDHKGQLGQLDLPGRREQPALKAQ